VTAAIHVLSPSTGSAALRNAASHTLLAKSLSAPEPAATQKLRQAAGEFEAMLLSNLWKSMKSSFADSNDSDDPAHETLDDMGIQAMSSAVGMAGGIGLGELIIKYLESRLPHSQDGDATTIGSKASGLPADDFAKSW
jgi:Rod binding domain-containing protein